MLKLNYIGFNFSKVLLMLNYSTIVETKSDCKLMMWLNYIVFIFSKLMLKLNYIVFIFSKLLLKLSQIVFTVSKLLGKA